MAKGTMNWGRTNRERRMSDRDSAKPTIMQPEPADPNERPPWE